MVVKTVSVMNRRPPNTKLLFKLFQSSGGQSVRAITIFHLSITRRTDTDTLVNKRCELYENQKVN